MAPRNRNSGSHRSSEIDGCGIKNWISIRSSALVGSTVIVLITAAVVSAVLLHATHAVVNDLNASFYSEFNELKRATNQMLAQYYAQTDAMLNAILANVTDTSRAVFETSQMQVMGLGKQILTNELDLLRANLFSYMDSITIAARGTEEYIHDFQLNISDWSGMMAIGRQAGTSMRFEPSLAAIIVDAVTGTSIRVIPLDRIGGTSAASIIARNNSGGFVLNVYIIDPETSQIIYPLGKCPLGKIMCGWWADDPRQAYDYQLASTLPRHTFGWANLVHAPLGNRMISVVCPVRDMKTDAMLGMVGRNMPLYQLQKILSSMITKDPNQRMYVIDLNGTLVASSHLEGKISPTPEPFTFERPYENVLQYPDALVNQSAQFLLGRFGSWRTIFNSPNTTTTTTVFSIEGKNGTSVVHTDYFVQTLTISTLNLEWLGITLTPIRTYLGTILDMRDQSERMMEDRTIAIQADVQQARVKIESQIASSWSSFQRKIDQGRETSDSQLNQSLVVSICVVIGVAVAAVLLAWALSLAITVSLNELRRTIGKIAMMDLEAVIPTLQAKPSAFSEIREMQRCLGKTAQHLSEIRKFVPPTLFAEMAAQQQSGGASKSIFSSTSIEAEASDLNANPVNNMSFNQAQGFLSTSPQDSPAHTRKAAGSGRDERLSMCLVLDNTTPKDEKAMIYSQGQHTPGSPDSPRFTTLPQVGVSSRVISLLITDIDGFNAYVSDPFIAIDDLMNIYMGAVLKALKDCHGVFGHVVGDKILSHWNTTTRQSGHQTKACSAAFGIMESLMKLRLSKSGRTFINEAYPPSASTMMAGERVSSAAAEHPQRQPDCYRPSIIPKVRIALVSGMALFGNVGAENYRCFQVFGSLVNLGFFLLGHSRKLQVSDVVCDQLTSKHVTAIAEARLIDVVPEVELPHSLKTKPTHVPSSSGSAGEATLEGSPSMLTSSVTSVSVYLLKPRLLVTSIEGTSSAIHEEFSSEKKGGPGSPSISPQRRNVGVGKSSAAAGGGGGGLNDEVVFDTTMEQYAAGRVSEAMRAFSDLAVSYPLARGLHMVLQKRHPTHPQA